MVCVVTEKVASCVCVVDLIRGAPMQWDDARQGHQHTLAGMYCVGVSVCSEGKCRWCCRHRCSKGCVCQHFADCHNPHYAHHVDHHAHRNVWVRGCGGVPWRHSVFGMPLGSQRVSRAHPFERRVQQDGQSCAGRDQVSFFHTLLSTACVHGTT